MDGYAALHGFIFSELCEQYYLQNLRGHWGAFIDMVTFQRLSFLTSGTAAALLISLPAQANEISTPQLRGYFPASEFFDQWHCCRIADFSASSS